MPATSTSCQKDVEKGAVAYAAASDSSAMHQQQTQHERNESLLLKMENERLRGELIKMQQQISRLEYFQKQQQHRIDLPPAVPNGDINRRPPTTNIDKHPVVLELPVTLRPNPSSYEITSSHSNRSNGNQKDHQSVSTTDDRETEEPRFIDIHQSSSGLHHRTSIAAGNTSPTRMSPTRKTSNINAFTTKVSTTLCNKMRRTEMDNSSNSSFDEDDPLAEARGLMSHDANKASKINRDEDNDAIKMAQAIESTMTGNESNHNLNQVSFLHSLGDRAGWLIGLLIFQSLSSFILANYEPLLKEHTIIFQFLTMLVGAGGNAGNQASVGVVRGIAVGTVNRSNARRVLFREFMMGCALSCIIGLAGFVRTLVFQVPIIETIAITTSLFFIVIISVAVGATLPLCMEAVGIDPAHSSTTIQVVMDITGVYITVNVSTLMLNSEFHDWLVLKLS